ncbi:MAG: hypothetical protein ACFFED_05085 [Candidatus Thorarchaeota archaeon]
MTLTTLKSVPCPKCGALVENVKVDEDSIVNASRVPVLVTAKCSQGHSCILFVDRNLTIRDIEAASAVVQDNTESSVDKAQKWMSDF